MNNTRTAILAALALSTVATAALAQTKKPLLPNGYPNKPIRVLVSNAPSGGLDIITRAISIKLSERIGQSVIVDNNGGASGSIAVNTIAASAPDGYNILSTGGTTLINAAFGRFEKDIRQTLVPVGQMSSSYYYFVVPVSVPTNTFKDFVAYAKARPGKLNYGSNGVGSVIHLGMKLVEAGTGIDMIHIPYKGSGQTNIDLAAGRLEAGIVSISGLQLAKAGKIRMLATTMPQRNPDLPDLPTLAESGLPGFDLANTYMLYAPAQTPANIVAALNREIAQVVTAPDLKEKFATDGAIAPPPYTPEQLKKKFIDDYARWDGVIKKTGIKPED
jgi:tripartite-type tricarboxylate transporter receptor subunit TctC